MTIISEDPVSTDPGMPKSAAAVGYAGLLPFIACGLAPFVLDDPGLARQAAAAGLVYAAVILLFLGGIRFGLAMSPLYGSRRDLHFVLSAAPALIAWAAVMAPPVTGLAVMLVAFLAGGWLDVKAVAEGRAPQWFARLRVQLTIGAVIATALMIIAHVTVF